MGKHESKKDRVAGDVCRSYVDDSDGPKPKKIDRETYEQELEKLQVELVKLQQWVKQEGLRVVVIFEGRDAAGKGGTIKRITEALNPRTCKVVALPVPTERETTQWYFQRYIAHLPAAGEIALFDRSWYNRPGVEFVIGFCSEGQVQEFFRDAPEFERMLIRSGIILIKYWFSISDEEQDRRFQDRIDDPLKRWKFSDTDLKGRDRWEDFSRAKDEMFKYTDTKESPWWVVEGDVKKRARLNCIHHLLTQIEYADVLAKPFKLPPRKQSTNGYVRPPIDSQTYIPEVY